MPGCRRAGCWLGCCSAGLTMLAMAQVRELKLRRAGISARARIASELRAMDEKARMQLADAAPLHSPWHFLDLDVDHRGHQQLALPRAARLCGRTRMRPSATECAERAWARVQVTELSRALAVHTMQLQMEYVASSLEDEAMDLAERSSSTQLLLNRSGQRFARSAGLASSRAAHLHSRPAPPCARGLLACHSRLSTARMGRQGSSDEVALLVANFGLLDMRLASMRDAVDAGEAEFIDAEDLAGMAADVPDLCSRLGIECAPAGLSASASLARCLAACWRPHEHGVHRRLECQAPLTPEGTAWRIVTCRQLILAGSRRTGDPTQQAAAAAQRGHRFQGGGLDVGAPTRQRQGSGQQGWRGGCLLLAGPAAHGHRPDHRWPPVHARCARCAPEQHRSASLAWGAALLSGSRGLLPATCCAPLHSS